MQHLNSLGKHVIHRGALGKCFREMHAKLGKAKLPEPVVVDRTIQAAHAGVGLLVGRESEQNKNETTWTPKVCINHGPKPPKAAQKTTIFTTFGSKQHIKTHPKEPLNATPP